MTDRRRTAGKTTQVEDSPQWRVEGSDAFSPPDEHGLSDTVVRMPKISVDGPAPTLPAPPPVRPSAPEAEELTRPQAFNPPAAAPPAAAVAAAPAPAPVKKKSSLRRTRKARLRLSRIDPWSVMKTSFLFSIAFGIMFWVSTWVLWTVIINSGLFEAINSAIVNIVQNPATTETWRIEDYINTNKVLGIAALLAVINVVITTALGTLVAFLYNLSSNILGGLELTLAED